MGTTLNARSWHEGSNQFELLMVETLENEEADSNKLSFIILIRVCVTSLEMIEVFSLELICERINIAVF